MNGELAQLAALAAHGNAHLAGETVAELFPGNSTFRYVNGVRFRHENDETTDCLSWWGRLRDGAVTRLGLVRVRPKRRFPGILEHEAVAFAGGLSAGILTYSGVDSRDLWRPHWEVTEPNHPDRSIWAIDYAATPPAGVTLQELPGDLGAARSRMATALERIRAFAATQELESWTPWFDQALALLASPAPVPPTHPDILPPVGYSLMARQVLSAAARGWVFGGMGSWNDADLPDTAYQSVTEEYFEAVMNGIVAAVNSFKST